MMSRKILEAVDLSIGYNNKNNLTVLSERINISFEKGKLVSLIGANGIGKSTLLRTLSGLQKPLSGNVLLDGKKIEDYTSVEKSKILSVVLTESLTAGNLTVFEIVALGRQPYTNWIGSITETDKQKVDKALQLAQINQLSQRKYFELSDGQLQKVLIARALAQDTPLIILDEPTTHLDFSHKVSMFRLLEKLASETGRAILFSTHDIDLAIEFSHEMVLMSENEIIQGTASELIQKGSFDKLFITENIRFDAGLRKFVFA